MCDICEPGIGWAGDVLIGVNLTSDCGEESTIEPSEPVLPQDLLCGGGMQRSDHRQRECVQWEERGSVI